MWCLHFGSLLLACTVLEALADLWPPLCPRARPGRNVTADSPSTRAMLLALQITPAAALEAFSLSIFKHLKHKARDSKADFIWSVFVAPSCIKHSPMLLTVHIFSCRNVLFFWLSSSLCQPWQYRYRKKCEGF